MCMCVKNIAQQYTRICMECAIKSSATHSKEFTLANIRIKAAKNINQSLYNTSLCICVPIHMYCIYIVDILEKKLK